MNTHSVFAAASPADVAPRVRTDAASLCAALRFSLELGFTRFGGLAGKIAVTHSELVERRRWISERRFLHAPNSCWLLPGSKAQQSATYIGSLLHCTRGGIDAWHAAGRLLQTKAVAA